jgi:hypothetical protein
MAIGERGKGWAVGLLLLLLGCMEGAPPPSLAEGATAKFLGGGSVAIVVVTVRDAHALQSAELEGPDGFAAEADSIDAAPSSLAVPAPGADAFAGLAGMSKTLVETRLVESVARIPVPDVVYYNNTWREWRVQLWIGEPGTPGRAVTLAAPEPPPPPNPPPVPTGQS